MNVRGLDDEPSDDPCFADIATLQSLFRSRALSPVDLVRRFLDRIEQTEPVISAYLAVDRSGALAAAGRAEALYRDGNAPALSGIPVAIKDTIDVAGLPTTNGSLSCPKIPKRRDAEVVRRLREAGAVILGKTNAHEFGLGGTTANALATTRNPWDPGRIAAGSSGGSAAAIAAGSAVLALGGDAGGSIRAPAAWCGIAGLRPTRGLIPVDGALSVTPMDVLGPMARHSRDLLVAMRVLVRRNRRRWADRDGPSSAASAGQRILVPYDLIGALCDAEVIQRVLAAAEWYRAAGATVLPMTWPKDLLLDARRAAMTLTALSAARRLGGRDRSLLGADVAAVIERGDRMGPEDEAWVWSVVERLQTLLERPVGGGDLVLTPVWPCDPPVVGGNIVTINARPCPYDEVRAIFTAPASLLGLPQHAFNVGFAKTGLPVGAQLMGAKGSDVDLLRLAVAFEEAHDYLDRRPHL